MLNWLSVLLLYCFGARADYDESMRQREDIYWRKAKLAARILLRAERRSLSAFDRRLAHSLGADPGVENRLIHQAIAVLQAQPHVHHE